MRSLFLCLFLAANIFSQPSRSCLDSDPGFLSIYERTGAIVRDVAESGLGDTLTGPRVAVSMLLARWVSQRIVLDVGQVERNRLLDSTEYEALQVLNASHMVRLLELAKGAKAGRADSGLVQISAAIAVGRLQRSNLWRGHVKIGE